MGYNTDMNTGGKLAIYQAVNGAIELPVDAKLETIWATQKQTAEAFGVNVRIVNNPKLLSAKVWCY